MFELYTNLTANYHYPPKKSLASSFFSQFLQSPTVFLVIPYGKTLKFLKQDCHI